VVNLAEDKIEEQFRKTKEMADQSAALTSPTSTEWHPGMQNLPDRIQESFDVNQQIADDYAAIGRPTPRSRKE
jgi:hypothetical protein